MDKPYVNLPEFARRVGVTPPSALLWLQAGRIPGAYRIGRSWFIPRWAKRPTAKPRKPAK